MLINFGFRMRYDTAAATPMIALLRVHPSRAKDLVRSDALYLTPDVPKQDYIDSFGNYCTRLLAPAGGIELEANGVVRDDGSPDHVEPHARAVPLAELDTSVLQFLLQSRYCDSDEIAKVAWARFGHLTPGWQLVQSIVDYVHGEIEFGYQYARATRSASQALREKRGVCRDFAHAAIALCRAMNIPARYATGYLGDIGVPPDPSPMDFSAWFEAYLDGDWHTFDARHRHPRIGRIVMARGRDASDVPLVMSFGPHLLSHFEVWTNEIHEHELDGNAEVKERRERAGVDR